jgi:hypothetical protein
MRVARVLGSLGAGFAWLAAQACSSDPPADGVVVGIQSEASLAGAPLGTLHVVTTVGASPAGDEVFAPSALPHEVRLSPPVGDPTAALAVRVEGYGSSGWTPRSTESPILVRTAETHFVKGQQRLLRIVLQGQCLLLGQSGAVGSVCTASQTCIDGGCQPDAVPSQDLEPYATDWASNAPDVCKPANAGPPVLQVGIGQTDYLPVTPGYAVQMEKGPQGGHHVWIAVRQRNLKQSGSTTTITSVVPTTGLAGPKTSYVLTYDPDEGNFCKLYGLRYQLDVDGTDYHLFLGKPLDVTVTVKDPSGATGTGVAHLNIDPQLLCPPNISGCS